MGLPLAGAQCPRTCSENRWSCAHTSGMGWGAPPRHQVGRPPVIAPEVAYGFTGFKYDLMSHLVQAPATGASVDAVRGQGSPWCQARYRCQKFPAQAAADPIWPDTSQELGPAALAVGTPSFWPPTGERVDKGPATSSSSAIWAVVWCVLRYIGSRGWLLMETWWASWLFVSFGCLSRSRALALATSCFRGGGGDEVQFLIGDHCQAVNEEPADGAR